MDHELHILDEYEPDDLEEAAGDVRTDRQDLGRIGIKVKASDDERMRDSMNDGFLAVAVLERRTVKLHTQLS